MTGVLLSNVHHIRWGVDCAGYRCWLIRGVTLAQRLNPLHHQFVARPNRSTKQGTPLGLRCLLPYGM